MDVITDPHVEYGAFGVCFVVIGILGYVVKALLGTITNHLAHIQDSIDSLPCKSGAGCRVTEEK